MNIKDKTQLSLWLSSGASLNTVMSTSRFGLVDNERFSERARDWFIFIWSWSAFRFSGEAGMAQDRAYRALGSEAFNRRIARVNALAKRICGGNE